MTGPLLPLAQPQTEPRRDAARNRELLIDAAQRLFAEQGQGERLSVLERLGPLDGMLTGEDARHVLALGVAGGGELRRAEQRRHRQPAHHHPLAHAARHRHRQRGLLGLTVGAAR